MTEQEQEKAIAEMKERATMLAKKMLVETNALSVTAIFLFPSGATAQVTASPHKPLREVLRAFAGACCKTLQESVHDHDAVKVAYALAMLERIVDDPEGTGDLKMPTPDAATQQVTEQPPRP